MRILENISYALLLVLSVGTCHYAGTPLSQQERASWRLVSAPPFATLSPKQLKILTLGHHNLYGDFATVWAIQFLSDLNLREKASAEEVYQAVEPVIKNKPRNEAFYMLACFIFALDYKRPEYCEFISVAGLQVFPDSWRIPMTQGFVATLIENNDLKAAAFYQIAAAKPSSPAYVSKLAKRLTARGYANGQDLNETVGILNEVPGGSKIIDILQEHFKSLDAPSRPIGPSTSNGESP